MRQCVNCRACSEWRLPLPPPESDDGLCVACRAAFTAWAPTTATFGTSAFVVALDEWLELPERRKAPSK